MTVTVRFHPPLNDAAGQDRVNLALSGKASLGSVVKDLAGHYGPEFRRHLYDTQERVIPAWCVFVNGRPVQLNRPENLATAVHDGDELVFLLNIAGGQRRRGNGDPTSALWRQGNPGFRD